MRKLLSLMLLFVAAFSLFSCGGAPASDSDRTLLTVSLGQSTAYFTQDDEVLYPIVSDMPYEGEYVEKRIKVLFSEAEEIALAFKTEKPIPALKYTVNNGEVKDFASGEFFAAKVEKTDTELTVKLKMWLSKDASDEIADSQIEFTIEAMGK